MKTFKILLPGLMAAQVIAAVQVYSSNASLAEALALVKNAGYITVPGPHIASGLLDMAPAFFGGLFFTFSIGAGISLLSLLAFWVWDRVFSRNKWLLIPMLVIWILCLAAVNGQGICFGGTVYFLIIPPIVYAASRRWMPPRKGGKTALREGACALPVLLIGLIWMSQAGGDMFISIRDNLLLSNAVGSQVNDFYYKYTMFPAEVFKTLEQKTIKTCNLESILNIPSAGSIEKTLIGYDYFNAEEYRDADLTLKEEKGTLLFQNSGNNILRTSIEEFALQPSTILKEFSDKSDRDAFFREMVFLSVLIGFPVILYVALYAVIHTALQLLLSQGYASITTALICFFIGAALLFPFLGSGISVHDDNPASALQSDNRRDRVAALRYMGEKELDVAGFENYGKRLTSPYVPERYWLAVALGVSQRPESYEDILILLDDPSPNVVCKAFEALGRRGNKNAVKEILQRIEKSKYGWYEQWYAYKALKALGWNQTGSR
ncbi:MAG: hypothetical protein JW943_00880 [Deltaproteobacteria bacterium]|nr:hypothetical protein [Deltaproteobacteria bacterium]